MESSETLHDGQKTLAQILIEDIGVARILAVVVAIALTPLLLVFVVPSQWALAATIPLLTGFTGIIGWYQIWLVRRDRKWGRASILHTLSIGLAIAFLCIILYAASCGIWNNAQGCGDDGLRRTVIANFGVVLLFTIYLWFKSNRIGAGMSDLQERAKRGEKLL